MGSIGTLIVSGEPVDGGLICFGVDAEGGCSLPVSQENRCWMKGLGLPFSTGGGGSALVVLVSMVDITARSASLVVVTCEWICDKKVDI